MPPPEETVDSSAIGRKKRIAVIIALGCGLGLPALHLAFLARFLPDWLNAVIVGGIVWICFEVVIPENTTGVFRRRKIAKAQQGARANAGTVTPRAVE